jgi:hypothetical protein
MAAGVVALILEANTNLTWRDVQGVIINSSRITDPSSPSWKQVGAHRYSHRYGFGVMDAGEAVRYAKAWAPLPPCQSVTNKSRVDKEIPVGSRVEDTISMKVKGVVEHVEVRFAASHPRRGDLGIVLSSPMGMESVLAELHRDTNPDYNDWRFGSIAHWGERVEGDWVLRVVDLQQGYDQGVWIHWNLTIYYH